MMEDMPSTQRMWHSEPLGVLDFRPHDRSLYLLRQALFRGRAHSLLFLLHERCLPFVVRMHLQGLA
jgi:hypothetical protein